MADTLSAERRSANMRAIRNKNTAPELAVRRIAHALGFRFRLHRRDLPGKPDLVFPRLRKVIFVHGCFWHQHPSCREGRVPGSRREYWVPKLARTVERDADHVARLKAMGWQVLTIWECGAVDHKRLADQLRAFLETGSPL